MDADVYNNAGSRLCVISVAEEILSLPAVLLTMPFDVIAVQLLTILSGDCALHRSVTGSLDSFDIPESEDNQL